MSMYNILKFTTRCPRCGNIAPMEAEFRFGLLNLDVYELGDTIRWSVNGHGLRFPKRRPENGDYIGEGYVECPKCHKDFWIKIVVNSDRIERAEVDVGRLGYIVR